MALLILHMPILSNIPVSSKLNYSVQSNFNVARIKRRSVWKNHDNILFLNCVTTNYFYVVDITET